MDFQWPQALSPCMSRRTPSFLLCLAAAGHGFCVSEWHPDPHRAVSAHSASLSFSPSMFPDCVSFFLSKTAGNYPQILDLQYGLFSIQEEGGHYVCFVFLTRKLSFSLSLCCHEKHKALNVTACAFCLVPITYLERGV